VLLEDPKRLAAVAGLEHSVPVPLERSESNFAHRRFIVDHQNGSLAAELRLGASCLGASAAATAGGRRERGALTRRRLEIDGAAMLLNDARERRQSQPRPMNLVVKNGSKIFLRVSPSMPQPVSATSKQT